MPKRLLVVISLSVFSILILPSLGLAGERERASLMPDEVMVQYPAGYTKLLVADLAKLLKDESLRSGIIEPLQASRHPLAGIAQVLELFKLDPSIVKYVAHGEGPELTSFSLIKGPGSELTMGPLKGLEFAAKDPRSPYKNWELVMIKGIPVVFTGGIFGPVKIQWAYIPTKDALWVGTEVAFVGEPNIERLRASTEKIIARMQGKIGYMGDIAIAMAVRGGDIAFMRTTDPTKDRPSESGENALGFSVSLKQGAQINFILRFGTPQQAAAAEESIKEGRSSYLALDLYRAELVKIKRLIMELYFEAETSLRGIVGLLMLVMPF